MAKLQQTSINPKIDFKKQQVENKTGKFIFRIRTVSSYFPLQPHTTGPRLCGGFDSVLLLNVLLRPIFLADTSG